MRYRIIALVAAMGLLLSAGIASANTDETDPRIDTRLTYGYDPEAQLFFAATQNIEAATADCTLNGPTSATYEVADDGTVSIAELSDGECAMTGVAVGTKGHINHGQFMRLFKETIEMGGHGCLNRWIAQSRLGKDDQQVKGSESAETAAAGGSIEFTTVLASCDRGKKDKGEDHPARGKDKERPGKSGKAKGHNKDD